MFADRADRMVSLEPLEFRVPESSPSTDAGSSALLKIRDRFNGATGLLARTYDREVSGRLFLRSLIRTCEEFAETRSHDVVSHCYTL